MPRTDAYSQSAPNPVGRYLEWSSDDKCFVYYDKEKGKRELVKLPLSIISLRELATIKGYSEPNNSGIYSNEVVSTKNEILNVRTFSGKEIASGLYQDIKDKVVASGGKFALSLYAYYNGDIINVSLKGASLASWSEFAKTNRKSFLSNKISFIGAEEQKKGRTVYSTPIIALGDMITEEESKLSDIAYDQLEVYIKDKLSRSSQSLEQTPVAISNAHEQSFEAERPMPQASAKSVVEPEIDEELPF